MSIRETTENFEKLFLSDYATFSDKSKGRLDFEEKCLVRTDFQRDRDRIIHSSAFRRLKHKTQVFVAPEGDHYRTRLTHTLEVAQIARTMARALRLNEDLAEAIAIGHDLGHTPFGHCGERVLDKCLEGGFRHYEQSLRVCDLLEKSGKGLNLTFEVRDGILCHTNLTAQTREGQIVRFADVIAYINHDIDDACKGGIITEDDIPLHIREVFGDSKTARISSMVNSIIGNGVKTIKMDDLHYKLFLELKGFMFERVYTNPTAKGEEVKAQEMIRVLFEYFTKNTHEMPKDYQIIAQKEGKERASADYISGMTDRYAVHIFKEIYLPKSWMVY